jgi:hypothetical protein
MRENQKAILDTEKRNAVRYVDATPEAIGVVAKNRVPIINKNGILVGHMGRLASEPTARRVGQLDGHAKLQQHGGRTCWVEQRSGKL